jgi:methylated-DNA-protein-cysteine methyltransferase related protein
MSKLTDKVVEVVTNIPQGHVASYGQVALIAGYPRGARTVGWILHSHGETTPWWRVINNQGRISTKCIEHNANLQKTMLEKENITINKDLTLDIEKYRWRPTQKEMEKLKLDDEYIFAVIEKFGI